MNPIDNKPRMVRIGNKLVREDQLPPRMISIYELRAKLMPFMQGYAWAEDALMDLWKMGAPDPSPMARPCSAGVCVNAKSGGTRCEPKWGCRREKRILLPAQFAKWWQDVAARQGIELRTGQAPVVEVKNVPPS